MRPGASSSLLLCLDLHTLIFPRLLFVGILEVFVLTDKPWGT